MSGQYDRAYSDRTRQWDQQYGDDYAHYRPRENSGSWGTEPDYRRRSGPQWDAWSPQDRHVENPRYDTTYGNLMHPMPPRSTGYTPTASPVLSNVVPRSGPSTGWNNNYRPGSSDVGNNRFHADGGASYPPQSPRVWEPSPTYRDYPSSSNAPYSPNSNSAWQPGPWSGRDMYGGPPRDSYPDGPRNYRFSFAPRERDGYAQEPPRPQNPPIPILQPHLQHDTRLNRPYRPSAMGDYKIHQRRTSQTVQRSPSYPDKTYLNTVPAPAPHVPHTPTMRSRVLHPSLTVPARAVNRPAIYSPIRSLQSTQPTLLPAKRESVDRESPRPSILSERSRSPSVFTESTDVASSRASSRSRASRPSRQDQRSEKDGKSEPDRPSAVIQTQSPAKLAMPRSGDSQPSSLIPDTSRANEPRSILDEDHGVTKLKPAVPVKARAIPDVISLVEEEVPGLSLRHSREEETSKEPKGSWGHIRIRSEHDNAQEVSERTFPVQIDQEPMDEDSSKQVSRDQSVSADQDAVLPERRSPSLSEPETRPASPRDQSVPSQTTGHAAETPLTIPEDESVPEALSPEEEEAMKFRELLGKSISARRQYEQQTRDQRINPILIANLSLAEPKADRVMTNNEDLIREVMQTTYARLGTSYEDTRAALVARFEQQRNILAEKHRQLRDEYLTLHKQWVEHCTRLDNLQKSQIVEDAAPVTGRTTRRSAATLGDAVRSDLEMEQIIASLGNEDLTDPNHLAVRNVANTPDMISVEKGQVDYLFDDTSGLVDDPEEFYDPRSGFYDWTPEEEAIFYQKYAECPKQFGYISQFLQHKTTPQCVLYYYIHKKKLVDFRNAAAMHSGKRRRARKSGKQKSNALLADIEARDKSKPEPGSRRRRGGDTADNRGTRRNAQQADLEGEVRPKRRRTNTSSRVAAVREAEGDDEASVDTAESTPAPSTAPKKPGRRGRKPKAPVAESPADSPAPESAKFIEVNDNATSGRGKKTGTNSQWSEADKDEFLSLLAKHGKNFKRIAASMPNKTTIQVSNYFKNNAETLDLESIAAGPKSRSPSIERPPRDNFIAQLPRMSAEVSLASEVSTPAGGPTDGTPASNTPEPMSRVDRSLKWLTQDHDQLANAVKSAEAAYLRQQEQKAYMSVLRPGSFEDQSTRKRVAN